MLAIAIFLGVSLGKPSTELSYKDGLFRISGAGQPVVFRPAKKDGSAVKMTLLKDSGKWVVWDQRGLTVRFGETSVSSFLPEIATTPKLFDRDQLLANAALLKLGKRSKQAAGVAGWQRVDDKLYLLLRWEDQVHQPWLEAIVRVDLADNHPKASLVGRFPGLTCGALDGSDRLQLDEGRLTSINLTGVDWGIANWDIAGGSASFKKLGEGLKSYTVTDGGKAILFAERTSYGTNLVGRIDLVSGKRKNLTEARGSVSFICLNPIVVRIDDPSGTSLRTTDTGAEMRLPRGLGISGTDKGILTWAPEGTPVRASLFSPKSWTALAVWRQEPAPPVIVSTTQRPKAAHPTEPSRGKVKKPVKRAAKPGHSRKPPKRFSKPSTHRRR